MNLDSLTPQQRACVQHVRGPLLVSAGAGSGKTFMLTQRIAYALLNPDESGVRDIDEVLAITFTELAASEIKARVRNKLREEGLADQAMKVDACWISTIHGMCSRILHENALDLGLDPQFGLIDDTDREALLTECLDAVLREEDGRGALFSEYDTSASSSASRDMLVDLLDAAANVRGGLDAVRLAQVASPSQIAARVYDAFIAVDAVAREDVSATGKCGATGSKIRDMVEDPAGRDAFERLSATGAGYLEVARALNAIPEKLGAIRKDPFALGVAQFRQACVAARLECSLGLALPARENLLSLARRVLERFEEAKAQLGVLDQNDLLLKTLDAFENHPEVEARYRDRFHLVMVDEFQDTSSLQIALVSHLTAGDARLCTVGDTQQSIYRFRGADVGTYLEHKRHMRSLEASGGLACELDRNFRSHGDVIEFVNRVFGQEGVFGDGDFIRLGYDEKHAERPGNAFPAVPRIDVAVTSGERGVAKSGLRHLVEAEGIARRFEALHAEGGENCAWGDMVILLGRMTNAEVYAQTLRAHGIPCTITGGSGFDKTPEALEVGMILSALANPRDDSAMMGALTGATFGLGGDELVRLGVAEDGKRRSYWAGFFVQGAEDPSPRTQLATAVLSDAIARCGRERPSAVLRDIAVATGWLDRLQGQGPQGMARAANLLKALRLVEDIESAGCRGIAQVATRYAQMLDSHLKEKPGTLNAARQDAVRIMTIHASKGLEFPVVALAEFNEIGRDAGKLVLETVGEQIFLSLVPEASLDDPLLDGFGKLSLSDGMMTRLAEAGLLEEYCLDDDNLSAAETHLAIQAHAQAEELGELRRKFYVGATRPREALVLAVNFEKLKDGDSTKRTVDDLRSALFGAGPFATAPEGIDFGGSMRASVHRTTIGLDENGATVVDGEPLGEFLRPEMLGGGGDGSEGVLVRVPEAPRRGERIRDLEPALVPHNPARAGTFSFSMLAAHDSEAEPDERGGHGSDFEDEGGPRHAHAGDFGDGGDPRHAHAGDVRDEGDPRHAHEGDSGDGGQDGHAGDVRDGGDPCHAHEGDSGDGGQDGHAGDVRDGGDPRHARPTDFGSALHQVCQLMAEDLADRREDDPAARFVVPTDEALVRILRTWKLPEGELPALQRAANLWRESSVARRVESFGTVVPEAPLYVALQGTQGEPIHLEGAMDLLCYDPGVPAGEQFALVIDYKTGGFSNETPERLQAKHSLQARCYAYAALSQGFAGVELVFVRLEQVSADEPDQPQTVTYRFGREDVQELHEHIRARYARL